MSTACGTPGRNGAFRNSPGPPDLQDPHERDLRAADPDPGSGLIAGWWFVGHRHGGPDVAFFLSGLVLVIGVAFVYLAANVGVIVYYWREKRSEFNWLWHAILPVVSGLVLLYALYQGFPPGCPPINCPADPYAKAPIFDGVWLLIGIGVLVFYAITGRDQWVKTAGASLGESEDDLAMARVGPAGVSAKV